MRESSLIAKFLIGSIDDSGYIRALIDLTDDLAYAKHIHGYKKIGEILRIVQRLDPAGVGARNLKECLLIQLKEKEKPKI